MSGRRNAEEGRERPSLKGQQGWESTREEDVVKSGDAPRLRMAAFIAFMRVYALRVTPQLGIMWLPMGKLKGKENEACPYLAENRRGGVVF